MGKKSSRSKLQELEAAAEQNDLFGCDFQAPDDSGDLLEDDEIFWTSGAAEETQSSQGDDQASSDNEEETDGDSTLSVYTIDSSDPDHPFRQMQDNFTENPDAKSVTNLALVQQCVDQANKSSQCLLLKPVAKSLSFLYPSATSMDRIPDRCSSVQYLEKVNNNIHAEWWADFSKRMKGPDTPNWRLKRLENLEVEYYEDVAKRIVCITKIVALSIWFTSIDDKYYEESREDVPPCQFKEFHDRLVIWKGELRILAYDFRAGLLYLSEPGLDLSSYERGMYHDFQDNYASNREKIWKRKDVELEEGPAETGQGKLYVVTFVGSYRIELKGVHTLEEGPDSKTKTSTKSPDQQAQHLRYQRCLQMLDRVADPLRNNSPAVAAVSADAGLASNVRINESQRRAVSSMRSALGAIQGPPGTGKSTTIFHLVHSHLPSEKVAVVTCVQNKAVGAVCAKFVPCFREFPFIVLGNPERLDPFAATYTIDAQVEATPAVKQARKAFDDEQSTCKKLQQEFDRFKEIQQRNGCKAKKTERRSNKRQVMKMKLDRAKATMDQKSDELEAARSAAQREVIGRARAVLCTATTASRLAVGFVSPPLAELANRIRLVVVDEAGTVPETIMPVLILLGAENMYCVGDQNQLEPFTHIDSRPSSYSRSRAAAEEAREEARLHGFFQRLTRVLDPSSIPMLTEQYRMHPEICDIVSTMFYDGRLHTSLNDVPSNPTPLQWFDYTVDVGAEMKTQTGSFINTYEAEEIAAFLRHFRPQNHDKSIMVITFYKAQQRYLECELDKCKLLTYNPREKARRGDRGVQQQEEDPNFLKVVSVDSAQGSEADIVLLSCVRSNMDGNIGFVSNPHRMCVAMSRAREQLVVFGNATTLEHRDSNWSQLYDKCGEGR